MQIDFYKFYHPWGSGTFPNPEQNPPAPAFSLTGIPDREIYNGVELSIPISKGFTPYVAISLARGDTFWGFLEYLTDYQPVWTTVRARFWIDPFRMMQKSTGKWFRFQALIADTVTQASSGINLPRVKEFSDQANLLYQTRGVYLFFRAEYASLGSDIKATHWLRLEDPINVSEIPAAVATIGDAASLFVRSPDGSQYFEEKRLFNAIKIYAIPEIASRGWQIDDGFVGYVGRTNYRALSVGEVRPTQGAFGMQIQTQGNMGGMLTVGNGVSNISFEIPPFVETRWSLRLNLIEDADRPSVTFVCDALPGEQFDITDSLSLDFSAHVESQEIETQKVSDAIQKIGGIVTTVGGVGAALATGNPLGAVAAGIGGAGLITSSMEAENRTWSQRTVPGNFVGASCGWKGESIGGFCIYGRAYAYRALADLRQNGGTRGDVISYPFSLSGRFQNSTYFYVRGQADGIIISTDYNPFNPTVQQMLVLQRQYMAEGVRFENNAFR